jgi:hypothetical protein
VDPAIAFAMASQLMRHDKPVAEAFQQSVHDLADLLSETIAAAPDSCPRCAKPAIEPRSRAQRAGMLEFA